MKFSVVAVAVAGVFSLPIALASAQGVNDAQIASIVVTANQVDIDAGKLATSQSTSDAVKAFARLMVTDHTGVNKSAIDLAAKLKVTPQDNPTSQSLKAGGEENLARLKSLKGAAFDKAYVDQEVTYHQQVIDALDKTLIPNATNEELRALLVKVRPAFVAHLEHASVSRRPCRNTDRAHCHARNRRHPDRVRHRSRRQRTAEIEDAHGHHRGHAVSAGAPDGRRGRHDCLGQQRPGSTYSHVGGRQFRFTDNSGGTIPGHLPPGRKANSPTSAPSIRR